MFDFSKLASNLSLSKLIEIIIIPIFYAISTLISFGCSKFTSYLLGLNEPETDFVTAMAVLVIQFLTGQFDFKFGLYFT